jgi:hypothetical protein
MCLNVRPFEQHSGASASAKFEIRDYARGWSQARLAVKLQLNGLDISREVLAQMECQIHCIRDKHIFHLARVLEVKTSDFFVGFEK